MLFNEADDRLLTYLNEEGQSIEPQWCAHLIVQLQRASMPALFWNMPEVRATRHSCAVSIGSAQVNFRLLQCHRNVPTFLLAQQPSQP